MDGLCKVVGQKAAKDPLYVDHQGTIHFFDEVVEVPSTIDMFWQRSYMDYLPYQAPRTKTCSTEVLENVYIDSFCANDKLSLCTSHPFFILYFTRHLNFLNFMEEKKKD